MEEQSPMISQWSLSVKKDTDEKTSDTHRGDISQRSETVSIPDVILESLKSDLSSSVAKLADDISDMVSQLGNANRPLSDVTNLSDSGGSKEEARRSWTNLSHISNYSSSNVVHRDHTRSKSWDPKDIRLQHRKSMELMRLLEDENQCAPIPSERVGKRTGLRYSSITTLNSIDDCEPRFCTTKTINLGASKGITIEIKNPIAPAPTPAPEMEVLKLHQDRGFQNSDERNMPAPVSVRVENKENTTRVEETRRAVPYARICFKEPEIKIAPVNQSNQSVSEKAITLTSHPQSCDAVSPIQVDYALSPAKTEHTYWTPTQKRRASDVLLKRSFERQSFDSKVSYFPVAKPRMSLLKPAQPIDPIYSNREELNQKISLSRILRSVTSPTPSEEKDLTPPWRKPSIASAASSVGSRRQSADNSRSISRNSLDLDTINTDMFPEGARLKSPIPTIQVESKVVKENVGSNFSTSRLDLDDTSASFSAVASAIDKLTSSLSPTQTLRISNPNTPDISPAQTLRTKAPAQTLRILSSNTPDISPVQSLRKKEKYPETSSSLERPRSSEQSITSKRTSTAILSSELDAKHKVEAPSNFQVTTKSTIRIVWPPSVENVDEDSVKVRPARRKSLLKDSKQDALPVEDVGQNESIEVRRMTAVDSTLLVTSELQEQVDVLRRVEVDNKSPDPKRKGACNRPLSREETDQTKDRTKSIFITNEIEPQVLKRSEITIDIDKEIPAADEQLKVVPPPRKKKVAFKLSNSTGSPIAEKRFLTPVVSSVKAIHFGDMSGDLLWANDEEKQEKPQADTTPINVTKTKSNSDRDKSGLSSASEASKPLDNTAEKVANEFQHLSSPKQSLKLIDGVGGASPLLRERFVASSEFSTKEGQPESPASQQSDIRYSETVKKTVSQVRSQFEGLSTKQKTIVDTEQVEKSNNALLPKPAERVSRMAKRASLILKSKEDFYLGEKDVKKMIGKDASSQFTLIDKPSSPSAPKKTEITESLSQLTDSAHSPKLISVSPEAIENLKINDVEHPKPLNEKSNTDPLPIRMKSKRPKELPQFILSETPGDMSSNKDSSESTGTDVSDAFREILLHRKGQKMTSLPDDSIYISPSLNSYCSNDQLPASEPAYSVYGPSKISHFNNHRDEQNMYEVVTKKSSSKAPRAERINSSVSSKTTSQTKRLSSHHYSPTIGSVSEIRIYEHPTRQASIVGSTFERSKSLEHHKAQKEDHEFKLRSLPKDNSAFEKRFARSTSGNEDVGKMRKEKSTPTIYSKVEPSSSVQGKGSMERRSERLRRSLQADFKSSTNTSVEEEKTIEDIVKVDGNDLTTSLETLIALNKNETDCEDRMTSSACSAITVRENKPPKHYLSFVSVMSRPKVKARRKLFNKEDKNKFIERLSQGSSADGWSETSSIIHTSFAAGDRRSDRQSSVFEYSTSKVLKGPGPSLPVAPPRRKQRKPFLPAKLYKPRSGLRSYRSSTSLNRSERSNSLRGSQSYCDLKVAEQEQNLLESKAQITKRSSSTVYQAALTESRTSVTAGASTPSLVGASDDFLKSLQQLAGALETCNKKWGLHEEGNNVK